MSYQAMDLFAELVPRITQEHKNGRMLGAIARMWGQAQSEFGRMTGEIASATTRIDPAWADANGRNFVDLSNKTGAQADLWAKNITGADPMGKINLVAAQLNTTHGVVLEQARLAREALMAASRLAAANPEAGPISVAEIIRPFQQVAGASMDELAGKYLEAAAAVRQAASGEPLRPNQSGGSLNVSPTSAAGPSGPGAAPGGAAPGGGAPAGGAAAGGPAAAGAGGPAAGAGGAGGPAADPGLAGGLSGGAPAAPAMPTIPGGGTTPNIPGGGLGGVPPFVPPVTGVGLGSPRVGGGGLSGGGGGGGGGGGLRVPGVGVGGPSPIPAAGATVSTPAPPAQSGAPAAPPPPATAGTAPGSGAGGGIPPMMPPMGGMGAGMGAGSGGGPNSGAARPVHGHGRRDGRTPGLPQMLSGKAGKADATAFTTRGRSTVESDVPTTVQLIDEDLWQVDRSAGPVTGQHRAH